MWRDKAIENKRLDKSSEHQNSTSHLATLLILTLWYNHNNVTAILSHTPSSIKNQS